MDGPREDPDPAAYTVRPVAVVTSPRAEVVDDDWGAVESTITLLPPLGPDALMGLEEFSHIDVVYLFDRVDIGTVTTGTRRPRSNPAWPEVGIFAQRGKDRPNRIGVTTCELLGVEGASLRVRGLDAIDRTPVLDIKPHLAEFDPRGPIRQPDWSHELMDDYW